jgi:DNA-binding response OmpR family regulator
LTAGPPLVLVVDADPSTTERVQAALAEDECLVLVARTSAAAMKIAERRLPAVLVAETAAAAPVGELIARLQALSPRMRVVLVLPVGAVEDRAAIAAYGPVLTKPLDGDKVQATVRSLVRLHGMASDVDVMRKDSAEMTAGTRRPTYPPRR